MLISIFFIAFMLIMAVIAIGSSLINGIINLLFGRQVPHRSHSSAGQASSTGQASSSSTHSQSQQATSSGGKRREKIFDKTEGEYVDFEEIKE